MVFNCHVPLAWLNAPIICAGPADTMVPAFKKITPFDATVVFVTVNVPAETSSVGLPAVFVAPSVKSATVTAPELVMV